MVFEHLGVGLVLLRCADYRIQLYWSQVQFPGRLALLGLAYPTGVMQVIDK